MLSKFPVETSHVRPCPKFSAIPYHKQKHFFKIVCCEKNASSSDSSNSSSSSSPPDNKFGFKLVGQSLGDRNWKFNDIDASEFIKSIFSSLLLRFLFVCVDDLDIAAYGLWSNDN